MHRAHPTVAELRTSKARRSLLRPAPAPESGQNKQQRRIQEAVEQTPGIRVSELRERLRIGWGTLQHHLRVLESQRVISRVFMGNQSHLVPARMNEREQLETVALHEPLSKTIALKIIESPGISQQMLGTELGVSRKQLVNRCARLENAGLIVSRRAPQRRRYEPTPALSRALAKDPGAQAPAPEGSRDEPRRRPGSETNP